MAGVHTPLWNPTKSYHWLRMPCRCSICFILWCVRNPTGPWSSLTLRIHQTMTMWLTRRKTNGILLLTYRCITCNPQTVYCWNCESSLLNVYIYTRLKLGPICRFSLSLLWQHIHRCIHTSIHAYIILHMYMYCIGYVFDGQYNVEIEGSFRFFIVASRLNGRHNL